MAGTASFSGPCGQGPTQRLPETLSRMSGGPNGWKRVEGPEGQGRFACAHPLPRAPLLPSSPAITSANPHRHGLSRKPPLLPRDSYPDTNLGALPRPPCSPSRPLPPAPWCGWKAGPPSHAFAGPRAKQELSKHHGTEVVQAPTPGRQGPGCPWLGIFCFSLMLTRPP